MQRYDVCDEQMSVKILVKSDNATLHLGTLSGN